MVNRGWRRVGAAHCAVLRVGGRSGGGTGVEGADGGGEGRELDHWAEASRGHRVVE